MPVLTEVDGKEVDANDLGALYDAFNPIVQQRIETFGQSTASGREELVKLRDAVRHLTALIFSVHSKLGAIVFQRERVGLDDDALRDLVEEMRVALGDGLEEADQQIALPT